MRQVRATTAALRIRSLPVDHADTDTGSRLVHGHIAQSHGVSHDGRWQFIVAPAGSGWASSSYLEEVPAAVAPAPSAAWPRVPHGLQQIRDTFGEAAGPAASRGTATLPAPIGRVTRFACHELVAPVFTSVFAELHRRGLWSLLRTFDGCYNDRTARGLAKKSTHAWGIAVDLNAATNGLGIHGDMDARIVAVFRDHGFKWGGDWSRPDGMHFQYAKSY